MARFQKGQSGNPSGRPKGSGEHSAAVRKLLDSHAEVLVQTAVDLALSGDTAALKLCIERLCPALRPRELPVTVELPKDASLSRRGEVMVQAMVEGALSPADANDMLGVLAAQAKLIEADDLIERIEHLESVMNART